MTPDQNPVIPILAPRLKVEGAPSITGLLPKTTLPVTGNRGYKPLLYLNGSKVSLKKRRPQNVHTYKDFVTSAIREEPVHLKTIVTRSASLVGMQSPKFRDMLRKTTPD